MIYASMNEYYLFSFISNKLMIMHDFINDSFNKSVVTLFTIFSLQDNFQIEDLIIKSANSEIRWDKEWRFCSWDSEKMRQNLENPKHGFCPKRTQLILPKEEFAQIQLVLRETQGSLSTIFSDLLLRPSSKSQLQSQIRLALVERWMEIYLLVYQLVGNNLIL